MKTFGQMYEATGVARSNAKLVERELKSQGLEYEREETMSSVIFYGIGGKIVVDGTGIQLVNMNDERAGFYGNPKTDYRRAVQDAEYEGIV